MIVAAAILLLCMGIVAFPMNTTELLLIPLSVFPAGVFESLGAGKFLVLQTHGPSFLSQSGAVILYGLPAAFLGLLAMRLKPKASQQSGDSVKSPSRKSLCE
jgi:hypothetical protein